MMYYDQLVAGLPPQRYTWGPLRYHATASVPQNTPNVARGTSQTAQPGITGTNYFDMANSRSNQTGMVGLAEMTGGGGTSPGNAALPVSNTHATPSLGTYRQPTSMVTLQRKGTAQSWDDLTWNQRYAMQPIFRWRENDPNWLQYYTRAEGPGGPLWAPNMDVINQALEANRAIWNALSPEEQYLKRIEAERTRRYWLNRMSLFA